MPKMYQESLTQAQKKEKRKERIAAKAALKKAESEARLAKLKKERAEERGGMIDNTRSKKEQRRMKKLKKKQALEKLRNEKQKESSVKTVRCRIIENHSTYCEGLKQILRNLQQKHSHIIETIIPGALHQVSSASEDFFLRIQRGGDVSHNNAIKCVAGKGKTRQDVAFVLRNVNCGDDLEAAIEAEISNQRRREVHLDSIEIPETNINKDVFVMEKDLWKQEHKEKHMRNKQKQKMLKEKKALAKRRRKLKGKAAKEKIDVNALADRDERIVNGKKRGKHAMR